MQQNEDAAELFIAFADGVALHCSLVRQAFCPVFFAARQRPIPSSGGLAGMLLATGCGHCHGSSPHPFALLCLPLSHARPLPSATLQKCREEGFEVSSFTELLAAGAAAPAFPVPPSADDYCTIMYTSGTTGEAHSDTICDGAMHMLFKVCVLEGGTISPTSMCTRTPISVGWTFTTESHT